MKHRAVLIPLIIAFQLALNTIISAAWILPPNAQIIPSGITVNGKPLGGMTRSQAIAYLSKDSSNTLKNSTLILQDGQKQWTLTSQDLKFYYDYAKTVDTALTNSQKDSGPARVINAIKLQAKNLNISPELSWDEQKLAQFLNQIDETIMIPAQDATIDYQKGRFLIVQEQPGVGLDIKTITDQIVQMVLSGKDGTLTVPKKALLPNITSQDLKAVNCELASFSSQLTRQANRSNNIILAAQALNGAVIKPGETFSFNQRVGQRTSEKGYKTAPVIVDDSITNDWGGGVCQVASTLYNASLSTGLQVVEHSGHSVPLKHVSGIDTTVYYNLIDLKLKNTLSNPVVISSKVDDNVLVVKLLGSSTDKK